MKKKRRKKKLWKGERGREEANHTRRSFVTATYLFATNSARSQLDYLNRVTRSRIRGPAVTLLTARFRCMFFKGMHGYLLNGEPSSMEERG